MKINSSAGLEHYQSYSKKVKDGDKLAKAKGAFSANNTDKVEISDGAAARAEASRIAPALAAEVESTASPERISALSTAVQEGTYYVESEDIADAMLDAKV